MIPLFSILTFPPFIIALFATGWYASRAWLQRDGKLLRFSVFFAAVTCGFFFAMFSHLPFLNVAQVAMSLYLLLATITLGLMFGVDLVLLLSSSFLFLRIPVIVLEGIVWMFGLGAAAAAFAPAVFIEAGIFSVWMLPRFSPGEFILAVLCLFQVVLMSILMAWSALSVQDMRLRLRALLIASVPLGASFEITLFFLVPSFLDSPEKIVFAKFAAAALAACTIPLAFSAAFIRPRGVPVSQNK